MTDESNGESGFEFVDKKEDFPDKSDASNSPVSPMPSPALASASASSPSAAGNILTSVAPPTALPSFITKSDASPSKRSLELPSDSENLVVRPPSQLSDGVQTTQPTSSAATTVIEGGPQVLIAPDSPTLDTTGIAGSLFTWVKDTVANSNVLTKVAEKAKSSVNSMITTLDPQMREFIYSGGDIEILVASDKACKVGPVREAFQNVFGNATIIGVSVEPSFEAAQPVGFEAGIRAAQERIAVARKSDTVPAGVPIIGIENFLVEIGGRGKWYDLGVVVLEDPRQNINLQTFTQATPVPSQIVEAAREATPAGYSDEGLAVTIGSLMAANLQVSHTEWHNALTGVARQDMIFLAAQSLAGIYKNNINPV